MDDRERQAALLDQFWDRLDRDLSAVPPDDLDPATADLTRRLVVTLRPPAPEADFTARLRQRLIADATTVRTQALDPDGDRPLSPAVVRSVSTPAPRTVWQVLAGGANRLAAAAVIIGLIVATVLLLRGLPQRGTLARPTAVPTPTASVAAVVTPPRPTAQAVATPSATLAGPGTWRAVGSMSVERSGHTATLLSDGRVLVVGGRKDGGISLPLASAELFDPTTITWSPAAAPSTGRTDHTATLLRDGRVLVVGGRNGTNRNPELRTAELYNPATNTWSPAAPLASERFEHLAVPLRDGTVLVIGLGGAVAERYDPVTDTWTAAGTPRNGNFGIAASMLPDGQVLVVGGASGAKPNSYMIVDRYDPATNQWSPVAPMTSPRTSPAAVTLPNGQVLVIGGSDVSVILATAERYDPTADSWMPVASMNTPRAEPITTMLGDGRVLVTGGHYFGDGGDPSLAELYDPATDSWTTAGRPLLVRSGQTTTLLRDGRVLVAGGEVLSGNSGKWFASAEIYTPGAAAAPRGTATPIVLPAGIASDRTIAAPLLLNEPGEKPDYTPQFAPDKQRIAYFVAGDAPSVNRLLVYEIDSGVTRDLTPEQGPLYASARWSADGRRLAYVRATRIGAQGVVAEVMVTDEDLGNPRAIYRFEGPQGTVGLLIVVAQWSSDGRLVLVGPESGSSHPSLWVRVDGLGSEDVKLPPYFPCSIMPPASQTLFGAATSPDGSYQICLTSGSFANARAFNVPAGALALVRQEVATGRISLLAPVIGVAYGVNISPDGAWITVGLEERRPSGADGYARHTWLAVIRSDGVGGLRLVGGEPYDLLLSGASWADGGRAYYLACRANCASQTADYLYELDLASATLRAVTHGWMASRLLGVARDGRVLLVRTRSGQPELHLVEPGPSGPVLARREAIAPGPVPEEAVAAVGGLLEARIARDEGRARSYLAPNLTATIGSDELLPPAEQQWSGFRYAIALRDSEGRLRFTVHIFTATGTLEQVVTLEARGGRWMVAWLGPIAKPR